MLKHKGKPDDETRAWDSSTRVDYTKREKKNLQSWRVPHETDPNINIGLNTSPATPQRGDGKGTPGTSRNRLRLVKLELNALLEACKYDVLLTEEVASALEEVQKDLVHIAIDHKKRRSPKKMLPLGDSPPRSSIPWRRIAPKKAPNFSSWSDDEEMDYSVPPDTFFEKNEDEEGGDSTPRDQIILPTHEVETPDQLLSRSDTQPQQKPKPLDADKLSAANNDSSNESNSDDVTVQGIESESDTEETPQEVELSPQPLKEDDISQSKPKADEAPKVRPKEKVGQPLKENDVNSQPKVITPKPDEKTSKPAKQNKQEMQERPQNSNNNNNDNDKKKKENSNRRTSVPDVSKPEPKTANAKPPAPKQSASKAPPKIEDVTAKPNNSIAESISSPFPVKTVPVSFVVPMGRETPSPAKPNPKENPSPAKPPAKPAAKPAAENAEKKPTNSQNRSLTSTFQKPQKPQPSRYLDPLNDKPQKKVIKDADGFQIVGPRKKGPLTQQLLNKRTESGTGAAASTNTYGAAVKKKKPSAVDKPTKTPPKEATKEKDKDETKKVEEDKPIIDSAPKESEQDSTKKLEETATKSEEAEVEAEVATKLNELGTPKDKKTDPPVAPLSEAIAAALTNERESPCETVIKKEKRTPWVQSPEKNKAPDDLALEKINEKQARAATIRALKQQEKQHKFALGEDKISAAKYKLEIELEKKKIEDDRRHDAAGARAAKQTRLKEEKARGANERVDETVYLINQQREEKAFEMRKKEMKQTVMSEQQKTHEKDRATTRGENYQAVMEKKRKLQQEREQALQEKIRRKEEQMARTDEIKRMEALQREKRAEQHSKRVAGLREAVQERDEEAIRKHQEKMQSVAANRQKTIEIQKAKAELSSKYYKQVLGRKSEDNSEHHRQTISDILASVTDSDGSAKARKRASRITLTMEKLAQDFIDKEKAAGQPDTKSKLSRPLAKLKPIILSGRLAQSKGIVTEITSMLANEKLPTLRPQDFNSFRQSQGMELLTKLMLGDVQQNGCQGDLVQPISSILNQLLVYTPQDGDANIEYFIRTGCLITCIDIVALILENDQVVPALYPAPLLATVSICVQYLQGSACSSNQKQNSFGDLKGMVCSFADARSLPALLYAGVMTCTYSSGNKEWLYSCIGVLSCIVGTHITDAKHEEKFFPMVMLSVLELLSDLLLPSSRRKAAVSPVRGYQLEDDSLPSEPLKNDDTCIAFSAIRLLTVLCRSRLDIVQATIKHHCESEFLHLAVFFLRQICEDGSLLEDLPGIAVTVNVLPPPQLIRSANLLRPLLHELLLVMGYITLSNIDNMELFRWGKTPLLQLMCNLPVTYFSASYRRVLFPTLVLISYQEDQNKQILQAEMNLCAIKEFIEAERDAIPKGGGGGSIVGDDPSATPAIRLKKMLGSVSKLQPEDFFNFRRRFPIQFWDEAIEFFS